MVTQAALQNTSLCTSLQAAKSPCILVVFRHIVRYVHAPTCIREGLEVRGAPSIVSDVDLTPS